MDLSLQAHTCGSRSPLTALIVRAVAAQMTGLPQDPPSGPGFLQIQGELYGFHGLLGVDPIPNQLFRMSASRLSAMVVHGDSLRYGGSTPTICGGRPGTQFLDTDTIPQQNFLRTVPKENCLQEDDSRRIE